MTSSRVRRRHALQPIHGYYLYSLGSQLHPIVELRQNGLTYAEAYFPALYARGAVHTFMNGSIYRVRTCREAGNELLEALKPVAEALPAQQKPTDEVDFLIVWNIVEKAKEFEAVLRAELGATPMYYVTPKHNMDMPSMITDGHLAFPPELATKVPEAIPDAQQAAKCIAFDLPTAAGFHLHRTNEAVLRRYFDHVAGAQNRPESRNMGDYLKIMNDLKVGDKKVKAALRDLKDLHRNPLMHPEDHIADTSDAVALMGNVNAAMTLMLKALPPLPALTTDAISALIGE